MTRPRVLTNIATVVAAAGAIASGAYVSADAMAPTRPSNLATIGVAMFGPDGDGEVIRCEFAGVDPATISARPFTLPIPVPGSSGSAMPASEPAASEPAVVDPGLPPELAVTVPADGGVAPRNVVVGAAGVGLVRGDAVLDAGVPALRVRIISSADERQGTAAECAAIRAQTFSSSPAVPVGPPDGSASGSSTASGSTASGSSNTSGSTAPGSTASDTTTPAAG